MLTCIDAKFIFDSWGDEWSLRALRFFFASTRGDKKFALRAASSLDSTTRKQRALLIFSACSNPNGNPFFFFNKTENILKRFF